jgi:hypothetical protein
MFCYTLKPYCDTLGQWYKTQYITEIIELTENKQARAIIPLKTSQLTDSTALIRLFVGPLLPAVAKFIVPN